MTQGSAGKVIKERFTVGKKKKNPTMNFISLLETSHSGSCTQTQAHTDTQVHKQTQHTNTHKNRSERSSNLLAATIRCDQSNNAICSCSWDRSPYGSSHRVTQPEAKIKTAGTQNDFF